MKKILVALCLGLALTMTACASFPKDKVHTVITQIKDHEVALYESGLVDKLTPAIHDKIQLYLDNALALNNSEDLGQLVRNLYAALDELQLLDNVDSDKLIGELVDILAQVLDARDSK